MIERGRPAPLGASWDGDGVNFALYSEGAESIELCLYDNDDHETGRFELPGQDDNVWHGYLPRCAPGQAYGFRAHGLYAPQDGLRYNPAKLLIDPYARQLRGELRWSAAVFDFQPGHADGEMRPNAADSAAAVPKSVVTDDSGSSNADRPGIPWAETVIYEANVRGYTMRHPAISDHERGLFRGMRNGEILRHLRSLGVTCIELMPVHEFIDEQFLQQRGLRNLWGYNTINFFAPARRYLGGDGIRSFREMVDAIHDTGLEVVLDVVYNHTAEGNGLGPTLSFRGIDNLSYYRTAQDNPAKYVDNTGCGNTINVDHPVVRKLIIDSLHYWAGVMGVDGFRFDLAPVLGRTMNGFSSDHPMLRAIDSDPVLRDLKLIAEPWDPGPGGYQLGHFPRPWAEWNDRYRDSVRRFWRGDADQAREFAKRLHGSADFFEPTVRKPPASINFVSCHDGFTLTDIVSYERRHNEGNHENNHDGHAHNYSANYGIEGPTDERQVNVIRRRQRLNMLATLLLSQGTPMLLGGDELGNSQNGNNNAYAQDNTTGWIDWAGLDSDPEFLESVRRLIRLRQATPLLRRSEYVHGQREIEWTNADGTPISDPEWHHLRSFAVVLKDPGATKSEIHRAVAILINATDEDMQFTLPEHLSLPGWQVVFASGAMPDPASGDCVWQLQSHSIACVVLAPGRSR